MGTLVNIACVSFWACRNGQQSGVPSVNSRARAGHRGTDGGNPGCFCIHRNWVLGLVGVVGQHARGFSPPPPRVPQHEAAGGKGKRCPNDKLLWAAYELNPVKIASAIDEGAEIDAVFRVDLDQSDSATPSAARLQTRMGAHDGFGHIFHEVDCQ